MAVVTPLLLLPLPPLSSSSAVRKRRPSKLGCLGLHHQDKNADSWENFYLRHQNKDRHYLDKDWGHFFSQHSPNVILEPNGHVLFRDYAIGDYAQIMLMNKNQVISENFYFRGDGTYSFYFSEDSLSKLFERAGFISVDVNTYNREIINRARNITMQRRWIRAVFRRP